MCINKCKYFTIYTCKQNVNIYFWQNKEYKKKENSNIKLVESMHTNHIICVIFSLLWSCTTTVHTFYIFYICTLFPHINIPYIYKRINIPAYTSIILLLCTHIYLFIYTFMPQVCPPKKKKTYKKIKHTHIHKHPHE